jgi:hypothetical protein
MFQRFDNHLRPNPRRIAHSNANDWKRHAENGRARLPNNPPRYQRPYRFVTAGEITLGSSPSGGLCMVGTVERCLPADVSRPREDNAQRSRNLSPLTSHAAVASTALRSTLSSPGVNSIPPAFALAIACSSLRAPTRAWVQPDWDTVQAMTT